MSDAIVLGTATAVSALVILYIVWSNRHDRQESDRKRDQQNLLFQIQQELDQHQTAILNRCLNSTASLTTTTAS
ncbi:MAG: hypothetical protein WCC87_10060 [Candidatus Korobacteraceae bacterium]